MNTDLLTQLNSLDETACETAVIAVGQQGPAGLAALAELLATEEADARFWAIRGLWANGSPEAIELLVQALQDKEEMVRSGAAVALGQLKAETAVEALLQLLTTDPAASGDYAADALAIIGQPAAPALIQALPHERSWVRVRAAKALISVESKQAIPVLFQALDDESYLVRHYAEEALTRLGVGQMIYFRV